MIHERVKKVPVSYIKREPQSRQLNRNLFLTVLGLKVWGQGVGRGGFLWGLSPWFGGAVFSLSHMAFPLCACVLLSSSYKDCSLLDYDPPLWLHYNWITPLKTLSLNKMIFWGTGGFRTSTCKIGGDPVHHVTKDYCLSFIFFCDEADLIEGLFFFFSFFLFLVLFFEVSVFPVCNRNFTLSIHVITRYNPKVMKCHILDLGTWTSLNRWSWHLAST